MLFSLHSRAFQNTIVKLSLPKSYLLLSLDHGHLFLNQRRRSIHQIITNYKVYKAREIKKLFQNSDMIMWFDYSSLYHSTLISRYADIETFSNHRKFPEPSQNYPIIEIGDLDL